MLQAIWLHVSRHLVAKFQGTRTKVPEVTTAYFYRYIQRTKGYQIFSISIYQNGIIVAVFARLSISQVVLLERASDYFFVSCT